MGDTARNEEIPNEEERFERNSNKCLALVLHGENYTKNVKTCPVNHACQNRIERFLG